MAEPPQDRPDGRSRERSGDSPGGHAEHPEPAGELPPPPEQDAADDEPQVSWDQPTGVMAVGDLPGPAPEPAAAADEQAPEPAEETSSSPEHDRADEEPSRSEPVAEPRHEQLWKPSPEPPATDDADESRARVYRSPRELHDQFAGAPPDDDLPAEANIGEHDEEQDPFALPPPELLGDLGEHVHSPEELAERRARERAARRRAGRQRLMVLIGTVIVIVVIVVLATGGGGSKPPPTKTTVVSKVARVGTGPSYFLASNVTSSTGVLTRNILIADRNNNRLLAISPSGQIVATIPEVAPSDAYLSATARSVVVTQHVRAVVVWRSVDSGRIEATYGRANSPGAGNGHLRDPQTAHLTSNGEIVIADLGNCRILLVRKGSKVPAGVFGGPPAACAHNPPISFGNPDAVFPTSDGRLVVTERSPGWIDVLSKSGTKLSAVRLTGLRAPYDANEYAPGDVVVVDRARPGTVEQLSESTGKVIWSYRVKSGTGELNLPTIARVLPNNGDVLVSDTGNDRVIVIDPKTNKIVWQFGKTAVAGAGNGFLHSPGSVDLVPMG